MNSRMFWVMILALIPITGRLEAQTPEEYEANYARRITQEMLGGVYIPLDLEDAFSELDRLSDPRGIAEFKSAPEDSVRRKLHFGLGRWIMINWGLEEGSRISHYLKQKGITLPDDMVEFIIIAWHRKLNGKPLRLEEEIAMIEKRMEEDKEKRDENKKVEVIDKKPHKE